MLSLSHFPEHIETLDYKDTDGKLFKEWRESLPKLITKLEDAKKYFSELEQKSLDEDIGITTINTGYIFTLHECLEFSQNKKNINDAIGHPELLPITTRSMYANSSRQDVIDSSLNDAIYHRLTGRYGFNGTFGIACHVRDAFFNTKLNESIRNDKNKTQIYLYRDSFEQAYRICDYVQAYLKGCSNDPRLQTISTQSKSEVARVLQE